MGHLDIELKTAFSSVAKPLVEVAAGSPPAVSQSSQSAGKPAYPAAAARPTQAGPEGIRFDFNAGARLHLPEGEYQSHISDLDTGNILFQSHRGDARINSSKRFYVRFKIEVWNHSGAVMLAHEYDARDRDVLITLPVGTIGDSIGWLPYAIRFQAMHHCRLTIAMAERMIPLFKDASPHIEFIGHDAIDPERFYATYNIGLFFDDAACDFQPTDFRQVGLHRTAGYTLGVDPTEEAPVLALPDTSRPIAEPYVCIGVQASTHAKKWNNPHGWHDIVRVLKSAGYRVICIDRDRAHGHGISWTHIPHGVEDETGDRPLQERARWLMHADAFVGLSSGLAWLAWAAGCPVVMISGFTHPTNEFATPGRVMNWHTCNSCWNDVRHRFDHDDYLWCPKHKGTDRAFECTRHITSGQVIAALRAVNVLVPSHAST